MSSIDLRHLVVRVDTRMNTVAQWEHKQKQTSARVFLPEIIEDLLDVLGAYQVRRSSTVLNSRKFCNRSILCLRENLQNHSERDIRRGKVCHVDLICSE